MRSRPTAVLPLAALALLLFGAWMHWQVLDPRRVGWLLRGNDLGQNSLGLIAYLRGGAAWPSLHDPLLMAPDGLSAALTDSNPLLALALRPFTGWLLPAGWQYAGWWLLLCVVLQVALAWRLVRCFVVDRAAALAGTALVAASPVLFARFVHLNLCAQWLILWALLLFVTDARSDRWRGWAAIAAVSWLVHPYLAVMVAAIWASAQIRLFVRAPIDRSALLLRAAPAATLLALLPLLLGYVGEPVVSTGTYGAYNMALDALWTPGDPGYSALLPAAAPTAGQGFEGLNTPGAGGLLALAIAVALVVARGGRSDAGRPAGAMTPARLLWLAPVFLVVAVVAVGPVLVWRGSEVAVLPAPRGLIDLLDPVRASGRLFWPAGYALTTAAVAVIGRHRHGRAILLAALLVQVVDLAPLLAIARGNSSAAVIGRDLVRTRDPRWDDLIARATAIDFLPHRPYVDMAVMEEVAWRALSRPRPVPLAWFYASREPRRVRARLAHEEAAFARGEVDPGRLTVLLAGAPPAALAPRAVCLDGIWVVPPDAQPFLGRSRGRGSSMAIDPHPADRGSAAR